MWLVEDSKRQLGDNKLVFEYFLCLTYCHFLVNVLQYAYKVTNFVDYKLHILYQKYSLWFSSFHGNR